MEITRKSTMAKAVAVIMAFAIALCMGMMLATGSAHAASMSKKTLSMTKGQTYQLKVKGTSKKVKWSTTKKGVAKVKNGLVTAKKAGTAVIKGKVGKKTYKCTVTVLSTKDAQKKANKLYKSKAKKTTVKINGVSYASSELKFALHDFSGDGVKDMIIGKQGYSASDSDAFKIYIYAFGKIKDYDIKGANFFKKGYAATAEASTTVPTEYNGTTYNIPYNTYTYYFYYFDKNGVRYAKDTVSATYTIDPTISSKGVLYEDTGKTDSYGNPIYSIVKHNGAAAYMSTMTAVINKYGGEYTISPAYSNTSYNRDGVLK